MRFISLAFVASALGLTAAGACSTESLAALDVFQLEAAAEPRFSPDGATVRYVRRSMDVMTDRTRSSL
jgi:hypothetical protein